MAIAQQYPLGTPKSNDLLIGTSIPDPNTNEQPKTKNFSISSILALDHDVILTSPGDVKFRLVVSDAGELSTTPI